MRFMHRAATVALLVSGLAAAASAQQNITQADIQRLQDNVYLADRDVTQVRARDAARATQLQAELDDLRDEVVYLRVKLRKERTLPRAEYVDVRDRIEGLRSRARGEGQTAVAAPAAPATTTAAPASGGGTVWTPVGRTGSGATAAGTQPAATTRAPAGTELPVGTEFDVRLQHTLNSGTSKVEDVFEGTTVADIAAGGRTVVPAGAVLRGIVSAVEPATRTNRTARMTVSFDQMTVGGRAYPMRATVTQAIEGEGIRGEAGKAGAGAAVGGLLGAVLGGVKGAVLGAVIGGTGTVVATEGREVELPQGSVLRVRLDAPLQITAPR